MNRKNLNLLSFKNPLTKNYNSIKINNKFKKSSTTQYNYINKKTESNNSNKNRISSINNNIYLNLFNKFNNTTSLRKNPLNPKQITSTRINNSQLNIEGKNLNILEPPYSSSFITKKNNFCNPHPSLIDSMNFIDNHGNINIRLNLKNQFINTTSDFNNFTEINYGFDVAEKMKEKDLKIVQLQNDLIRSKEIINNINNKNNLEKNKKNNLNLKNNSKEKNLCFLSKSSESVDKILKTAFNAYTSNNSNILTRKKSSNRKNYKNNFLKRCGNKNILEYIKNSKTKEKYENKKTTRDNSKTNRNIYSGNYKKKQSDYLRLFLPLSNYNTKPKFNSYSNNKKNIKNKTNPKIENMNKTEKNEIFLKKDNTYKNKKNEDILDFVKKCQELKEKTKNLLDKYIILGEYLYNSKIK
jgi:hypothetical protein